MVMGDNSCSRGHGFESRHLKPDGHDILHIDLLFKLYCLFEKTENRQEEVGFANVFNKLLTTIFCTIFQ